MATACLNRVSAALKTSAAVDICLEPFRSVGKLDKQAAAAEYAPACLDRLRDLLKSKHGIRTLKVENKEIARFVEDAETKDASSINAKEYQDLMDHVMKYSALKARRSPRRRFTLGVMCSAASAVAITAVTAAASTGVLVAAAPVGAAVGALAVGASSLGASKRDKKRAVQHTPPAPANTNPEPTTSAAAEEAAPVTATKEVEELITLPQTTADDDITPATPPAVAQAMETAADDTPVPPAAAPEDAETDVAAPQAAPELDGAEAPVAAPAEETAALETQLTPKSDELVSAVVEVSSPADPTVAAPPKETPFSAVTAPFPSHSGELNSSEHADAPAGVDTASSADASPSADVPADDEDESQPLPELLRCPTPERADSDAAAGDSAQELLTPAVSLDVARSADLPPMPKKKKSATKKIKKSLSKGYKSFKKAMSINSSNDLEAAAAAAVARADKDVLVAPTAAKPPSGFSFRRSFSRDSARDMNGEGLSVQGSEGSATLKKMKELLRRSFTISPRTSMDLGQRGSFDISDRGTKAY